MSLMASPLTQRIADTIRRELRSREIKAADLGRYLYTDATPNARALRISRRLNGDIPFSVDELEAVGDFLGVPIELLLEAA